MRKSYRLKTAAPSIRCFASRIDCPEYIESSMTNTFFMPASPEMARSSDRVIPFVMQRPPTNKSKDDKRTFRYEANIPAGIMPDCGIPTMRSYATGNFGTYCQTSKLIS